MQQLDVAFSHDPKHGLKCTALSYIFRYAEDRSHHRGLHLAQYYPNDALNGSNKFLP